MSRTRKSAKDAGAAFERLVADYLAERLGSDAIDRQVKNGSRDLGDVRGVTLAGQPVAVECKDYAGRSDLPQWYREAEAERGNKGAAFGVVVWKRRGTQDPGQQHVSMTLKTFADILASVKGES